LNGLSKESPPLEPLEPLPAAQTSAIWEHCKQPSKTYVNATLLFHDLHSAMH